MHDWLRHKPSMQPPHSRDFLSPGDGNYKFPEEVFDNGMDQEELALEAYKNHRHDDLTLNMSSDSCMGWGSGVWIGAGNGEHPPPPAPVCQGPPRQDIDLNAEAPGYSSPYVPPPSLGGIPLHMPPMVSKLHHLLHFSSKMEALKNGTQKHPIYAT
jgi:hypothetical protein